MRTLANIAFTVVFLGGLSCSKEFSSQPLPNSPPDTYLFLDPDSTLNRTASQQNLRWWGADADGLVKGYLFSFDSLEWHYTDRNDSLFALSLSSVDTLYRFFVSAFDQEGNGSYDAVSAWGPEPFSDLNNDNIRQTTEPFIDVGAVDPTPAALRIPIKNTPPRVSFVLKSDVPETTFTVATFQWRGTDLDGSETIESYFYALDDTTAPEDWKSIPGNLSVLTLFRNRILTPQDPTSFRNDSLTEGTHVLYLKARDVAGAYSGTVRMPDTSRSWYVKEPKGDFLVIDDYAVSDFSQAYYGGIFDTLMGGRLRAQDILDLKFGATPIRRGNFVPALIHPTLTETLKLFKYIFWYSDNAPSLDIAQTTLPEFAKNGGKVLFTAGFSENASDLGSVVGFAPIDNIEPLAFAQRLNPRDSLRTVSDPTYPVLARDTLGSFYSYPRGILPKVSARVLYQMQSTTRWVGQPIVGVKNADVPTFVFLSVVLHRFGTPPANVASLFRKVYQEEFGVQ